VLLLILLPLAAGGVVLVVCTLVLLCCFEAVGNTYRSIPAGIRRQLRSATLYHYCAAAFLDQYIDPDSGNVTLHRRARTIEPYLTGRRALYLYTAHGPRGAKSNHPRRWRGAAAVITVSGADLLDAVGDAQLKYRRRAAALAILGDYHGPGHVAVRCGDVVKIKNDPAPPGHDPKENHP
jgi:hypothetical protein